MYHISEKQLSDITNYIFLEDAPAHVVRDFDVLHDAVIPSLQSHTPPSKSL